MPPFTSAVVVTSPSLVTVPASTTKALIVAPASLVTLPLVVSVPATTPPELLSNTPAAATVTVSLVPLPTSPLLIAVPPFTIRSPAIPPAAPMVSDPSVSVVLPVKLFIAFSVVALVP